MRSAVSDAAANLLAFVPSLGTREVIAFGEGVPLPTRLVLNELPAGRIPFAPLLQQVDDAKLEMRWRELALLAAGQCEHPEVYYALLRLAGTAEPAVGLVALRRLGEIGDTETNEALRALEEAAPAGSARQAALAQAITAIEERIAKRTFTGSVPLRRLLERVAWLEHHADPRAMQIGEAQIPHQQQGQ